MEIKLSYNILDRAADKIIFEEAIKKIENKSDCYLIFNCQYVHRFIESSYIIKDEVLYKDHVINQSTGEPLFDLANSVFYYKIEILGDTLNVLYFRNRDFHVEVPALLIDLKEDYNGHFQYLMFHLFRSNSIGTLYCKSDHLLAIVANK